MTRETQYTLNGYFVCTTALCCERYSSSIRAIDIVEYRVGCIGMYIITTSLGTTVRINHDA